jgi:prepilin-type N-terminal cleavage/methylation domain-containing protein
MLTFFTSRLSSNNKGFTLPEVIITVLIMSVIASIVVSGQSAYSEGTLLNNSISTIALDLRQAQVYGVSVKEFSAGSNEFSAGYGISFSVENAQEKTSYISFADRTSGNLKYVYDGTWACLKGGSSECVAKTDLPSGYTFENICEISLGGAEDCTPGRVDITFVRPETDAHILFFDMSGNQMSFSGMRGARINLISPKSLRKSVIIYVTGQVSQQ